MNVMKSISNAMILRGVLTVVFGILAMVWPVSTLAALALLWGVYALFDAATSFGVAFSPGLNGWARFALLALGVLGVIAGIIAIFQPLEVAVILAWVLGIWLIVHGILTLVAAFGPDLLVSRWLLVATGILSFIAGILFVANPGSAALGMAIWLGAFALVWGVTTIAAGFALRKTDKDAVGAARGVPANR